MHRYRVTYTIWGRGAKGLRLPAYALCDLDTERPINAVLRAIGTANSLAVCGGPRREAGGIWQATIGKRIPKRRGGGFSPVGDIWIKTGN